jgi:hypothetical protein
MELLTYRLGLGSHNDQSKGIGCVNEIASQIAGTAWSDHPADCVDPVLTPIAILYNDSFQSDEALNDDEYARSLPWLLVGTNVGLEASIQRAQMAATWANEVIVPMAAKYAEYAEYAEYVKYAKYAESAESAAVYVKYAKYAESAAVYAEYAAVYAKSAAEYAKYVKYAKSAAEYAKYAAEYAEYAKSAKYAKYAKYAKSAAEYAKYAAVYAKYAAESAAEYGESANWLATYQKSIRGLLDQMLAVSQKKEAAFCCAVKLAAAK